MNIPAEQPRGQTSLGRDAESDCARAMAEVEKVLHELALFTRRSSSDRTSPANEASNAPSLVPAPAPIDRLVVTSMAKTGDRILSSADLNARNSRADEKTVCAFRAASLCDRRRLIAGP